MGDLAGDPGQTRRERSVHMTMARGHESDCDQAGLAIRILTSRYPRPRGLGTFDPTYHPSTITMLRSKYLLDEV